jgi:non-ribosomal peptide synthase protein (TIGR01720 family)
VGWFTSLYPVLLKGEGEKGPGAWLKSVKEQLRGVPDKGLGYGVLRYINREVSLAGDDDPWQVVFNYLGQSDEVIRAGGVLSGAPEPGGEAMSGEYRMRERLALNSIISNGELVVQWRYSRLHFAEGVVQQIAEAYIRHLTRLIEHCAGQQPGALHYTPSDFGLGKEIGYEELDRFLDNDDYELDDIMNF